MNRLRAHPRLPIPRLALSVLLATISCASPTEVERVLERAERAEALWLAGRPVHYVAVEQRSCECLQNVAGPVRLVVSRRQGASFPSATESVVTVTYESTGETVPTELRDGFPTAQGLFELIRSAARDGADVLEAEFDPVLGYPRSVRIDPDRGVADEELIYAFELVEEGS